ncbi:MAG: type II toxin-antitoxin system Phd/YefM family antitoxin [Proteobacteria bacterium]|nr:type II toxin-antitoxin system Phd/YefM family antitoxin [Pseudomonadota bacterium]
MQTAMTSYITSPSGRKKAVIIPIKEYQRLLEDLHDLSVVAERHEEYAISLAEMKQRLKDHAQI